VNSASHSAGEGEVAGFGTGLAGGGLQSGGVDFAAYCLRANAIYSASEIESSVGSTSAPVNVASLVLAYSSSVNPGVSAFK